MNLYHDLILDEAKHPSNFGQLETADQRIVEYNASCGDQVKIDLKIKDGQIVDLKWRGSGCIISLAATSQLSRKLIGMKIVEVKKLNTKNMLALLGLDNISPGRIKCLMLSLTAILKNV